MASSIRFTPRAERDFGRLPGPIRRRFASAFEHLAKDPVQPRPGADIRPLAGVPGGYRLRIGRYRGVYQVLASEVVFTRFGHRSVVYR